MQSERVVAILDDEPVSCLLLEYVIEVDNMTARRFSVPEEFLDYMKDHRPTCILMDMDMPGMSGIEVQRRLREMGNVVPIIIVSAHSDLPTVTAALDNGASAFIKKPIDPREVLRRIHEATELMSETAA